MKMNLGEKIDKLIMQSIDIKIFKKLYIPPTTSRKGQNGRLLIIAGSHKFHGSLVLSSTMASKIVDFVYVHTNKENFEIIKKTRQKLAEFIYINKKDLKEVLKNEVEAILIGPGIDLNEKNKKFIKNILKNYKKTKTILDAGALRLVDLSDLHENCVLTPHAQEFKALFGCEYSKKCALEKSKQTKSIIILKGKVDYIFKNGKVLVNNTGNAGMTKGGTGDVLAGLLAGLACKNDLLLSAQVALYLNGKAGDNLKKKFGFYYSASELIPKIQENLSKF